MVLEKPLPEGKGHLNPSDVTPSDMTSSDGIGNPLPEGGGHVTPVT